MNAPGAVADDFREERRIELVRALPPKKGASLREESSSEDTTEEAVEEKGRREVSWRGNGGRECSPPLSPTRSSEGEQRGEVSFATPRDGRQRKSSSSLSRFSFIDTRGFVF